MSASQTTMDKLYGMRLSVMAQAYRDQEEMLGVADMTFDERFAMIVDAEWDSRRINKRTRLLRQAAFSDPEANVIDFPAPEAPVISTFLCALTHSQFASSAIFTLSSLRSAS